MTNRPVGKKWGGIKLEVIQDPMPEPSSFPAKLLITGGENKSPWQKQSCLLAEQLSQIWAPSLPSLILKKERLTTVFTHSDSFPHMAAQHAAYQRPVLQTLDMK